mgnify:CR=1 FL=1
MNPFGKVPILELGDSQHISETVAIFRYFEVPVPEDPKQRSQVIQWLMFRMAGVEIEPF